MTTRVFIDGAAGTTGLEIRERLEDRPEFELLVIGDDRRKDKTARKEALAEADIAILCLPDDAAREAVELAAGSNTRIIDASSAHRVADGWAYGFSELVGKKTIANAQFVSNPGCYPTGFLALVAPLVRAGLVPADWPFTVNAVSGYSGGGNGLIARFKDHPEIAFRNYGLDLAHKHRPEMKTHAGLKHGVIFAPAVVPAYRGMMVEVPLHLGAMDGHTRAEDLHRALQEFYREAPLVTVADMSDADQAGSSELLLSDDTPPTDTMTLHVFGSDRGYHARLIALLDNLGKGAGGAAVQNLNLMCGLPETQGLRLPA